MRDVLDSKAPVPKATAGALLWRAVEADAARARRQAGGASGAFADQATVRRRPRLHRPLLVQPKYARLKDDGTVTWLNAAPEGVHSLEVADVAMIGDGGSARWTSFPVPQDFPVDKVTYDGVGVFSLWSRRQRISGTLPQMLAATRESRALSIDGATQAQIAQAFRSIPTTLEPPPPRTFVENYPPVNDPLLGAIVFDSRGGGYGAKVRYDGRWIHLWLQAQDATQLQAPLEVAHRLVQDLAAVDARARTFAARELLALRNETWTEEGDPPVSEAEFIAAPVLTALDVQAGGGCRLTYEDGDLFWGHWIDVDFSADGEPVEAGISG